MGRQAGNKGIEDQDKCLELANSASVGLVHIRPSQIALLEGGARTNTRRHGATEVGVV